MRERGTLAARAVCHSLPHKPGEKRGGRDKKQEIPFLLNPCLPGLDFPIENCTSPSFWPEKADKPSNGSPVPEETHPHHSRARFQFPSHYSGSLMTEKVNTCGRVLDYTRGNECACVCMCICACVSPCALVHVFLLSVCSGIRVCECKSVQVPTYKHVCVCLPFATSFAYLGRDRRSLCLFGCGPMFNSDAHQSLYSSFRVHTSSK